MKQDYKPKISEAEKQVGEAEKALQKAKERLRYVCDKTIKEIEEVKNGTK